MERWQIVIQNPELVIREYKKTCGDNTENEFRVLGSVNDKDLLTQIVNDLTVKQLVYCEKYRTLTWSNSFLWFSYQSKVFYNVTPEIVSGLLGVTHKF